LKIGYARISTNGQELRMQLEALRAAGCEKIYKETASGAKPERPVLEKLLKSLKPGDELVVWRLDRLGRALGHLVTLVKELGQKGVAFSSLHERIDTGCANGKLQFHMFCALAEFERALISERTKAGLAAALARPAAGPPECANGQTDRQSPRSRQRRRHCCRHRPQARCSSQDAAQGAESTRDTCAIIASCAHRRAFTGRLSGPLSEWRGSPAKSVSSLPAWRKADLHKILHGSPSAGWSERWAT
jgi:DNA invertase Pin-like site-specific DNA recombinase